MDRPFIHHAYRLLPIWLSVLTILGCETQTIIDIPDIQRLYAQGQYRQAYTDATRAVETTSGKPGPAREEAAYMAGLSAVRLGDYATADRYLAIAAQSSDPELAGQAIAQRGLVADHQEQYENAIEYLLQAAQKLSGQQRANAYYHAALAEQKLGRWQQARTHLTIARSNSRDRSFQQQTDEQRRVTAFAIQLGAYRDRSNAERMVKNQASRLHAYALSPTRIVYTSDHLYRVQVGRFNSMASAQQAAIRMGNTRPIVVSVTD